MQIFVRSTPLRVFFFSALGAGMLACVALIGCEKVDPLSAIRKQQAGGDYQGSIEPLRKLLATSEDNPEVNFLYGRALAFTQPNLAGWSLRKAMEDPEWLIPAGSQLMNLSLIGNDFNEAIRVGGQILERDPENVRVLLMRANAYAHSKRNPELALADAKRVLEIDRDATEAYEPLILALLGLGRLDEAREALDEAGQRVVELGMTESSAAWHCATTAAFDQESGNLDQARKTWIACLDAHPADPDVVTNAINFYGELGESDRSLEIMRAALASAPNSQLFRTTLARQLQLMGDPAEGEAVLREATRSDEPALAAVAWMDLGKFRQSLGDFSAAADAVERAVELGREAGHDSPQLLFELADALVLADRFDRALEVAEDLPIPAHRHLILGRVAQERRDPARALAEFDESLRLWPNNPWARYYAALAAEEMGDFERAIEEYRNSIRIQTGATEARVRGGALLIATGDPGAALTVLTTALADTPLEIEGLLLGIQASGTMGSTSGVAEFLSMIETSHPAWAGQALAVAAAALARRSGPEVALSMLTTAPGVDFLDPRFAPTLRAIVQYSHETGKSDAVRAALQKILAAQPDSSALQEIHGFELELAGAPAASVSAAYARALELEPGNAQALAGLGRLTEGDDPEAALGFFDRAAAADPSDPDPRLRAARVQIAAGKLAAAEQRLDALLVEHPFEAEAAAERARLDLEQGVSTAQTLERAQRAVRLGGGADALELLSRVHAQRGEAELAEKAAKRAQTLRAAKTSEGSLEAIASPEGPKETSFPDSGK